jgi:hypothetical protein
MPFEFVQLSVLGGLLAACAGACHALPVELPPGWGTEPRAADPGVAVGETAQPARPVANWGIPARQSTLGDARGGSDTVSNDARLSATVSNNSATNVATGSNVIDHGSFANMSGLPMVIQNTGANVLIQSATVINLQLK